MTGIPTVNLMVNKKHIFLLIRIIVKPIFQSIEYYSVVWFLVNYLSILQIQNIIIYYHQLIE